MSNSTTLGIVKEYEIAKLFQSSNITISSSFLKHFNTVPYIPGGFILSTEASAPEGASSSSSYTPVTPEGETTTFERGIRYSKSDIYYKTFRQKIEISNQLALDTSVDIVSLQELQAINGMLETIVGHMTYSGIENMENATLEDKKTKFQRLFQGTNMMSTMIRDTKGKPFDHDELFEMYEAMNKKGSLQGSFWLFDEAQLYSIINAADGREMIDFNNLVPGSVGTYLGLPIYRNTVLTMSDPDYSKEKHLAVALIKPQAYTLSFSKIRVRETTEDTYQANKGVKVYVIELEAEGLVTDKYAKWSKGLLPEGTVVN
ncbi:hypothetical protein COK86_20370 [Bacillus cereus]|uniref:Phage major capsid protein n=1 Tax=Bacillus cereus TaxID=1396 RepID=A0A2B3TSH3_BACCE|nr:hypothetical protein [Bacillus cereus]PFU40151.1 hypothetical protein COK86_20370 [Bacillus cereus]